MSGLTLKVQAFRSGQLSQDDLLAAIYHALKSEEVSPATLVETLQAQQLQQPLPDDVYQLILSHVQNWPRDPTVITRSTTERADIERSLVIVGDVLQGRFKLVQLIAHGGMSRVFKAIDLRRVEAQAADPHIAIKVLTEPFSEYFGSIAALQSEAQKLQSLSHPNIVRVMDCDRDGQTVFMTMEYIAGESLQKRLRARGSDRLDLSSANSIVSGIGHALAYAHGNHIVHGDLKPGNVIITPEGGVKVIDFGMARFLAPAVGSPAQTENSSEQTPNALTPRYASPQLLAGQIAKQSDDVYALASVAYEVLCGKQPFPWSAEHKPRDPAAVPTPRPEISARQYQAIAKALSYDEKNRTPSIANFLSNFTEKSRVMPLKAWAWIGSLVLLLGLATFYVVERHPLGFLRSTVVTQHFSPGSNIRDCPTCPLMIVLAAGRFNQGTAVGNADTVPFEQPQHRVTIGYVFAMGLNEITVADFREFADAVRFSGTGCNTYDGEWHLQTSASWLSPGFSQSSTHPATCVSWNDARAYAAWLSRKTSQHYRLPSASEWEYAARAGSDSTTPWGAEPQAACIHANIADQSAAKTFPGWSAFPCNDAYVTTAPVGSFQSNAFGLNDLLGNVFEWVADCWHGDYVGAPTDGAARMDGDCSQHEMRGGSWFSAPRFVGASYRNHFAANYRSNSVGFRLVREVRP